jgi:hypothetical protein
LKFFGKGGANVHCKDVLLTAGVKFSVYAGWPPGNVYATDANQLIGAYRDLQAFRASDSNYSGWQVHHVVEDDDLHCLGVSTHAPAYPDQLCVLIPERAHVGRINSILRRENPTRYHATAPLLVYLHGAREVGGDTVQQLRKSGPTGGWEGQLPIRQTGRTCLRGVDQSPDNGAALQPSGH